MEGRGSKEEEEVVAAAAAAAAASAVADDELVEGAPFPDPGREEEEEDDDDDGEDARAVTTRLWERAGERGRSSRGAAEAEEEKEVEVEVEPAKRMLSAACIEDDDAADAEEDITAGARSALALFGVAPGAALALHFADGQVSVTADGVRPVRRKPRAPGEQGALL